MGNNCSNFSPVHFSSKDMKWKTPMDVFDKLNDRFKFDCDPCPSDHSIDGLTTEWGKCNFVNPPYGRQIAKWIKKGYDEWKKGKTVVFLIPSRTDTSWWHDYVMDSDEIIFIRRRLRFSGVNTDAPFPSCVVVFNGK